mmetsp:Transcript_41501/g.102268  ORF Transcript_41501/g.102268 Transcript_41501/m.102268 type:complete len:320 (-) Transcript_41501:157-1116(-)
MQLLVCLTPPATLPPHVMTLLRRHVSHCLVSYFLTATMPSRPSFIHEVPPTLLMHGAWPRYGKVSSKSTPRQKSATSARAMEPASPAMTLMTPVGGPVPRPPGRTMQNSRPLPGPAGARNSCSWLFLSVKMERITVLIRILNMNGAWSAESPAPMEVTTDTRVTPAAFMPLITFSVPSFSMVLPTSLDFPPREITTPVVSAVMTLAMSAALFTSPWTMVRLGSLKGWPSFAPPLPGGYTILEGVRASTVTLAPRLSAWNTHSEPVPPVPPNTTMLALDAGVAPAAMARTPRDTARTARTLFLEEEAERPPRAVKAEEAI